jgi:DNA-directed RNA polymerase subunit RPC12/RpoP
MTLDGKRERPLQRPQREVELWPALWYACEECGRDNFVRLTSEQSEDGAWFAASPDVVRCAHCGEEFATA